MHQTTTSCIAPSAPRHGVVFAAIHLFQMVNMKTPLLVLSLLSASLLTGCDLKSVLSDAKATGAESAESRTALVRDGTGVSVPEASPLRQSLVVAPVELRDVSTTMEAPGVVEAAPEKLVKITPPLPGRIARLHKQLGDVVKAGDPLATIDSPELGTAISEQIKARATLLQAQNEYARQKELVDSDIAAKKDLEAAQLSLSAAQSDARATQNRLLQLGVNGSNGSQREYVLRSPISGRVVQMDGAQGGYWNDNNASIMSVADLSTVWLSASVSEKDLSQVFVGQEARIELNAYSGRDFAGKVQYVGDLLDPETRTARVRVAIRNADGLLKPGMFARMHLTSKPSQALMIPAAALLQSGLYTRVFVEHQPFHYESRIVSVGPSLVDQVQVLSGLSAGERIVVKNGVLLND